MHSDNPPIPPLLWALTLLEAGVVALAGGLLLFVPDLARALWPWPLTPFNSAALGAVYLGALGAIVAGVLYPRWIPARLVVPAIGAFTAIVLAVSLLHLPRFAFTQWGTWLWFGLYLLLPLNAAYQLWRARPLPAGDRVPLAAGWAPVLRVVAALSGLYALALLLLPEAATGFWPWPIDRFHGQLYSAAFVAVAMLSAAISRGAATVEVVTAGAALAASGGLTLLALGIGDAARHSVPWAAAGTWVWMGGFALLLGVGAETLRQGLARPDRAGPAWAEIRRYLRRGGGGAR